MEGAGVEEQLLVADEVEERTVPTGDRVPRLLEAVGPGGVGEVDSQAGDRRPRQQHTSFLERLAHGGDPKAEPAGGKAECRTRARIVASVAASEKLGVPVPGIDGAAREHVGAAHEDRLEVAPQHEDLEVGIVTDEHHGGKAF